MDANTSTISNEPIPQKKIKIDVKNGAKNDTNDEENQFETLLNFKPVKILSNNTDRKTICVQGTFVDKPGDAVILFEKKAFSDADVTKESSGILSEESRLKLTFKNDVYYSLELFPNIVVNGIKTTIIHPATEKHINKFAQQNVYLINETYELYQKLTLPHIQKEQFTLDWVYNILDHKSEVDRIVFEDSDRKIGFILLPDLKWDGKTLENLYLLAIVHQKNLKSLRDLNDTHLPLLRNLYDKGVKIIGEKYQLPESQLRIYLHYQPSFYHLHVHFTYLRYDAPGIHTEKSHLLSTVINNIQLVSDYYQKTSLSFVVRENDNLFKKYEEEGVLTKIKKK